MGASDEVRLLGAPFARYALIRAELVHARADAARRIVTLLLALGAFVSFTASGRLVVLHVAFGALFWSFVPALQALAAVAGARAGGSRAPIAEVLAIYFAGHAPWIAWLAIVSGACAIFPSVFAHLGLVLPAFALLMLVAIGWGGLLTFAAFRSGLGLARAQAARATAAFYATYVGAVLAWYFATNQIPPQLFGVPA